MKNNLKNLHLANIIFSLMGMSKYTKSQVEKWGNAGVARNRPGHRELVRRAHIRRAETNLNAKRKRKKIAKRARK